MTLLLQRQPSTDTCTLGELFINGVHEAFSLEPHEDGPHPAIPAGRYRVTINFSNRFQRMLPIVLGVPGRLGIRFHPGNTAEDTEGCILLGQEQRANQVLHSVSAMAAFQPLLARTLANQEDVWLTVQDAPSSPMRAA